VNSINQVASFTYAITLSHIFISNHLSILYEYLNSQSSPVFIASGFTFSNAHNLYLNNVTGSSDTTSDISQFNSQAQVFSISGVGA
jgi:hypothetical protein